MAPDKRPRSGVFRPTDDPNCNPISVRAFTDRLSALPGRLLAPPMPTTAGRCTGSSPGSRTTGTRAPPRPPALLPPQQPLKRCSDRLFLGEDLLCLIPGHPPEEPDPQEPIGCRPPRAWLFAHLLGQQIFQPIQHPVPVCCARQLAPLLSAHLAQWAQDRLPHEHREPGRGR